MIEEQETRDTVPCSSPRPACSPLQSGLAALLNHARCDLVSNRLQVWEAVLLLRKIADEYDAVMVGDDRPTLRDLSVAR